MRTTTLFWLFPVLVLCLVGLGAQSRERTLRLPRPPHRDAIGTRVDPQTRSDPTIDTYISEVTLSEPVRIQRAGLEYFEVRGTIDGVGWGGENGFVRLESHYTYGLPYVLRIPVGWNGTLVVFRHGTSSIAQWKALESTLGRRNIGRTFHEYADRVVSDVALHPARRWAFFAVNYTPFALDGRLSSFLLPGTDDDNDGRVDEDPAQDDDRDGLEDEDPRDNVDNDSDGLVDEDPAVDDDGDGRVNEDPGPTPANVQIDVTMGRDTTLLAKHLLKVITSRSPTVTIGTGHSTGANINFLLNTGVDPTRVSGRRIRVGDNYTVPYDSASAKVFDGFVSFSGGFPMAAMIESALIDPARGLAAPTLFIGGEADSASIGAVRLVKQIADRGLNVTSWARIYMVRNMPHIDSDFARGDPCGFECARTEFFRGAGERLSPVSAALLDAMRRWVVKGTAPPQSIFNGIPADLNGDGAVDSMRFPQSTKPGPNFSFSFPYVDDPSLDQSSGPVTSLQNNVALSTLWASVQQSLNGLVDSIFLPETACRRGRFSLVVQGPTGTNFVPFDQPAFTSKWGSSAAHQTCRVQTVDALIAKGLYDPTVVTIDIRPDQFPNRVDSRGSDQIPVAIFTTIGFDATHINTATLKLAGASPARGDRGEIQDVNGDGRSDLVVHFPAREMSLSRPGDVVVDLEGRTWSGLPFNGTDLVEFVN
jgi:alpha/beta hydrolase family protein